MSKYLAKAEPKVIRLKISDGKIIETFAHVLQRDPNSLFAELAEQHNYIDCANRDGRLIRLLIDSLRKYVSKKDDLNRQFLVPEEFEEWHKLIAEARYWRLHNLEKIFCTASTKVDTIIIAYHGTIAFGKQGYAIDVNFRKIHRILVSGCVLSCRQVFGKNLNETRDGNMDSMRYTSRFYLTHTFLEQAFDALAAHGYKLVASTRSKPSFIANSMGTQISDEEQNFLHYSHTISMN